MRLAELLQPAPREIRVAGAITAVPGLAAVVFAVVLVIGAITGTGTTTGGNSVLGEAAYYAILGGGLLACGIGLLLGYVWARSPSLVLALILLGLGWYLAGPSHQPLWGTPVAAVAVLLIVLLFRAPSRAWALGQDIRGQRDGDA